MAMYMIAVKFVMSIEMFHLGVQLVCNVKGFVSSIIHNLFSSTSSVK